MIDIAADDAQGDIRDEADGFRSVVQNNQVDMRQG